MRRRTFGMFATLLPGVALVMPQAHVQAQAPQRIGVMMLHGKNPGDNRNPHFRPLKTQMEREGWLVNFPNMPWANGRYLDGNWDKAMAEIAEQVKDLRARGATKIVLVGHSFGSPAALSFAARGGDVQAVVLLAPGHVPKRYYTVPALKAVRGSVDRAREMAAAGKGAEKARFDDINQGRALSVTMAADDYLSYFDPASDAEMSVTAPRVPATTPVMTVIGDSDPLFRFVRSYFVDSLPANPRSQYLEVIGTHLSTPEVASADMLKWIKAAVSE